MTSSVSGRLAETVPTLAKAPGRLPRYHATSSWIRYLLVVLAYAGLFTFWQAEPVPVQVHLLGVLLMAICLLPLFIWYAQRRGNVPMFELICLSYGLQFSLPLYLVPNQFVILSRVLRQSWEMTSQALAAVILGMVTLLLGYYGTRRAVGAQTNFRLDLPFDERYRGRYLVAATTIALATAGARAAGLSGGAAGGAILGLLANQLSIVIVLLAAQVYGVRPTASVDRLRLYGIVAVASGLGLTSGFLEASFIPLLLLFISRWQIERRLPYVWLLVGVILLLVLNTAKSEYRQVAWYGGAALTPTARIALWGEVALGVATGGSNGGGAVSITDLALSNAGRLDLLHKFVHVQQMTPGSVPYYQGETYTYLLYGWIPRAIWPTKPEASVAIQRVDLDYQLVESIDSGGSSFSIGFLPEAYANFGIAGIALMLGLQGAGFALLDRLLNGQYSDGGRAIYLAVMILFLNGIGSSTVIFYGNLLQVIAVNAAILRPFCTGVRATPQDEG